MNLVEILRNALWSDKADAERRNPMRWGPVPPAEMPRWQPLIEFDWVCALHEEEERRDAPRRKFGAAFLQAASEGLFDELGDSHVMRILTSKGEFEVRRARASRSPEKDE